MAKVNIKGPIISSEDKWIYEWFSMEATCPRDVEKEIDKAKGEDIEVIINSGGGYVDEGSEIYTMLKDYSGKVIVKIVGMAASAASVIAMSGDVIKMSPTARLMIHNAAGGINGDYRDMEHGAEVLKECNKSISNAYKIKTNLTQDELLDLMNKETFMNAQKAKELGFIDEIMFDTENKLTNFNKNDEALPNDVIQKIRNMKESIIEKKDNKKSKNEIVKIKEKLVYKNKNVSSFLFYENERMI